jgi:hypothetical protein
MMLIFMLRVCAMPLRPFSLPRLRPTKFSFCASLHLDRAWGQCHRGHHTHIHTHTHTHKIMHSNRQPNKERRTSDPYLPPFSFLSLFLVPCLGKIPPGILAWFVGPIRRRRKMGKKCCAAKRPCGNISFSSPQ